MTTTTDTKAQRYLGQLQVAKIIIETPTVKTFRLVNPTGGALPFDFLPGQFLQLRWPATDNSSGKEVKRSFTIASSPTQTSYVDLTIKREDHGLVSRPLCDDTKVGDLWSVMVPYGHFCFTGVEAPSIVLIGGGVGVTPMMSVFRYLIDTKWPGAMHLLYSYKNLAEYIYRDELIAAAKQHPNVHLYVTLTREESPEWQGPRGRLNRADFISQVHNIPQSRVHICGPMAMIREFKALSLELGIPKDQVKIEAFGAEKKKS